MILFYIFVRIHGTYSATAYKENQYCENKIKPFGCIQSENDTNCFMIRDGLFKSSFCYDSKGKKFNLVEKIAHQGFSIMIFGSIITDHEIKINNKTGEKYWE